jgi:heme/copper-type cytochrome/quinol oxidase subunit 4
MNKQLVLLLSLFFHLAYAQTTTSSRILGIGIGTLIIIIAVIFSIIWCLACRNSSKPEIYSILGLLVPGILILAFALTPK